MDDITVKSISFQFSHIKVMKFVILEGIDGSGKTAQAKLLYKFLRNEGKKVLLTEEPTHGKIGKLLRNYYLKKVDYPLADTFLFFADRAEHMEKIKEDLKKKIVISDRYYHSTVAYQSAQGVNVNFLKELCKLFPKPSLTFIIDCPAEIAIERISKSKKVKMKFEKLKFLKKLRKAYLKLPKLFSDEKIIVIDGRKSKKEVFEDILNIVKKELRI
jgi:dTMP kinase